MICSKSVCIFSFRLFTAGYCKAGKRACPHRARFVPAPSERAAHPSHCGNVMATTAKTATNELQDNSEESGGEMPHQGLGSPSLFPDVGDAHTHKNSEVYIILSESMKERSHEHSDCARLFWSRSGSVFCVRASPNKLSRRENKPLFFEHGLRSIRV